MWIFSELKVKGDQLSEKLFSTDSGKTKYH